MVKRPPLVFGGQFAACGAGEHVALECVVPWETSAGVVGAGEVDPTAVPEVGPPTLVGGSCGGEVGGFGLGEEGVGGGEPGFGGVGGISGRKAMTSRLMRFGRGAWCGG